MDLGEWNIKEAIAYVIFYRGICRPSKAAWQLFIASLGSLFKSSTTLSTSEQHPAFFKVTSIHSLNPKRCN